MKTKILWVVAGIILLGLLVSPVGAKKDDLYDHYETLTSVVDKIIDHYVVDVDREKLFYGAYAGMLQTLDPYSQFLPPVSKEDLEIDTKGEFGGVGIEITLDEHKILSVITPLEGTPAFKAGVQSGDKIWKIEGKSTEGMSLTDAVKKLRGKRGTTVTITVIHNTDPRKPVDITITRDIIRIKSIIDVRLIDEKQKIGYIRMTQFQENTVVEMDKAIKSLIEQGMQALIIDLRFNPGGLLDSAIEISDRFVNKGIIVSTKGRNDTSKKEYRSHGEATYPNFPIAVLVTGQSASASEIVAGCLQDHKRAVIIGSRTFGKGSVQTVLPLENGKTAMRLTTAYYYTPSGRLIHRKPDATEEDDWGIYPDVEVKMSPQEVVKLWQEWRKRHLNENRPPEESMKIDESKNEEPKKEAAPVDLPPLGEFEGDDIDAAPEQDKKAEEPFVDKPLEAARLFLSGQLFTNQKVSVK